MDSRSESKQETEISSIGSVEATVLSVSSPLLSRMTEEAWLVIGLGGKVVRLRGSGWCATGARKAIRVHASRKRGRVAEF